MNNPTILIIDDEPQICRLVEIALQANGMKVLTAATATAGQAIAASHQPQLILLDIQLPDTNGLLLLEQLRQWYQQAIIMLTVQNTEADIVFALEHGANDYITKPFRTAELVARIRNALKASTGAAASNLLVFDNIEIDLTAHTVHLSGCPVKLTVTEYKLLILLATNYGRVLTQAFILKNIWGVGSQTEYQYLRVFIGTLRKKIEANPATPTHIITENGIGYRFQ
jgi:two-component system, OmpR family, KDP operon response regulator KdpE